MEVAAADVAAMRRALESATAARAAGEVPIGALLLDRGGDAYAGSGNERETRADPTAHAEIVAIRRAAAARQDWRLTGTTLVVTLEPCPMCAGAAWAARVDRVVFGAWNDAYGAAGSQWDLLRDPRLPRRPEVVGGVLADECAAVLGDFFSARRQSTG